MSDWGLITLRLDHETAEGYLLLLESRPNDVGFRDDAEWLRNEMRLRGWLDEANDE